MTRRAHRQSPAAPALVALVVVVCAGSAGEAATRTTPVPARTDRPATLSVQEQEALASLLSCLDKAAKQLQSAASEGPAADRPRLTPSPSPHLALPSRLEHAPPAAPLRAELLNLPPPAFR